MVETCSVAYNSRLECSRHRGIQLMPMCLVKIGQDKCIMCYRLDALNIKGRRFYKNQITLAHVLAHRLIDFPLPVCKQNEISAKYQ